MHQFTFGAFRTLSSLREFFALQDMFLVTLLSTRTEAFQKVFANLSLLADINMGIWTVVVGAFSTKEKLTNRHLVPINLV